MHCEYLFKREARRGRDGRVSYRTTGQRLRVSNIGTGPADHLRIGIQPVGDGAGPVILNARGNGSVLAVDTRQVHRRSEWRPAAMTSSFTDRAGSR